MKIDDNLSTIFDLAPVIQSDYTAIPQQHQTEPNETEMETDYSAVRDNLHEIIYNGKEALLYALEIAKKSEDYRVFDVVGNLMRQLSDTNHKLVDLHLKKQKLTPITSPDNQPQQIVNNNALFVGSTNELSKIIQNMNKGTL